VEAAFALPLLALVLVGTIDFGRLFYRTMAVTQAARAGAQWGTYHPGRASASGLPQMEAVANIAAIDIPGGVSPAAGFDCTCFDLGTETAVACTATCGGQLRVYVTVTASSTFTTVVNYPGIPTSVPIVRAVRMRAQ
jgi:Flp pilus assembly protein TadG